MKLGSIDFTGEQSVQCKYNVEVVVEKFSKPFDLSVVGQTPFVQKLRSVSLGRFKTCYSESGKIKIQLHALGDWKPSKEFPYSYAEFELKDSWEDFESFWNDKVFEIKRTIELQFLSAIARDCKEGEEQTN